MANSGLPVLNFVGRNFSQNGLSILIVSRASSAITRNLCQTLQDCRSSSILLHVFTTQSIKQLLQQTKSMSFDFVVFLIKSGRNKGLQELNDDICMIDKHYFTMSRVCLVLYKDVPFSRMQISSEEVHCLAATLHTPVLVSHLENDEEFRVLANQILNLSMTVTGAASGVPLMLAHSQEERDWLSEYFSALY
ncbi:hypothetical protein B566_EDAN003709 [Ephemera danica]|nr:hypothetical protein B566_EDAN003709 [Ephemera danica]